MDKQLDDLVPIEQIFKNEILRELQEAREEEMNLHGMTDLISQTSKAEDRRYGSHTVYGDLLRKTTTLEIADELKRRYAELQKGKAMEGRAELSLLKDELDWKRVAYITLSVMLDYAGPYKKYKRLTKDDKKEAGLITTTELWLKIGKHIMIEANLRQIKKTLPRKYKELKDEFFTQHAGFEQRITNIKREVRSLSAYFQRLAAEPGKSLLGPEKAQDLAEEFRWVDWSQNIQVQVGSLLARVVNDLTGLFTSDHAFNEYGKTQHIFVWSSQMDEYRDEVLHQAKGFAYFPMPMLVPPKRWSSTQQGGFYASAATLYDDIVRGYRKGTVISDLTYEFINRQQEIPFCIDPDILEIQRFLADKGWTILGEEDRYRDSNDAWRPYKRPDEWEIPKLPEHLQGVKKPRPGASQEHVELYNEKKRISFQIRDFHTRQEEMRQRAKPVERFLRVLKFMKTDEVFYFPWYLDWRGRCYPMIDALNPQGPEYQKAVLNFAEPVPVDDRTDFWLSVGIASAAGQDKESFESRVAWTKSNLKLVKAVAKDPLGNGFEIWRNMPEPWIFLRACIEWQRIHDGQTYTNIACLGQDATQSGLQLLGGMVLDKQTCDLVNCVPGHDKPQDAYGTVLNEAIRLIEEDNAGFPTHLIKGKRKLVKTPVMTKVYAAGHDTRVGQIRKALAKEGIRLAKNPDRNEEMIEYLTTKVEEAMMHTIPGVDLILEWFQRVVRTALERGVEDISYETPSGNIVVVEYREPLTKQIDTESLGSTRVRSQPNIVQDKGKTIPEDVERAIAANFTHGAGDACLLHLAFHDVTSKSVFASTHDCVYAPPSQIVDDNHRRVREAFITICTSNVLQKFAERNRCADLAPPIVGTYNPTTVRRARYFFC